MIEKIRKILWQIGIVKDCPLCGKCLQKVGHEEVEGWQYYRCSSRKCGFGKAEKNNEKCKND